MLLVPSIFVLLWYTFLNLTEFHESNSTRRDIFYPMHKHILNVSLTLDHDQSLFFFQDSH